MFLQARTRILSRHGKPTVCQSQLPYLFLSLSQHWVAMSPRIHSVPTPAEPLTPWNTTIEHQDMAHDGGLYSQDQIRQKLDTLEFENFHQTTTMTLAASICNYDHQETCPDHPQPKYIEMFNPPQLIHKILDSYLGSFITTLLEVGEITSIFVAVYLLFGLVRCLYFYIRNLLMLTKIHGPSWRLLTLACPEIMSAFTYQMTATQPKVATPDTDVENQEIIT